MTRTIIYGKGERAGQVNIGCLEDACVWRVFEGSD
jgi:hypothetical protein